MTYKTLSSDKVSTIVNRMGIYMPTQELEAFVNTMDDVAGASADWASELEGRVTELEENPAFPDAPDDGGAYIRVNGQWAQLYAPLALSGDLPDGTVDEPYTAALEASGGRPPYTLGDVLLPPGLDATLTDAAVTVAGTPTEEWEGEAHIDLSDSLGTAIRRAVGMEVLEPVPELLSPPVGFEWTPPVNVYRNPDGTYSTDFDADDWKVEAVEDIWVSPSGSNTTGNGSEAAPYRSVQRAMQHATDGADVPYNVFIVAGDYLYGSNFNNTVAQRDLNIIAIGGRVRMSNRRSHAGSWTAQGGGAYTTTLSSIGAVYDDAYPVEIPDGALIGQELARAADSAECQATPGSFYIDGSTVWVHLSDGRVPDSGPTGRVHLFNLTTQVPAVIPGRRWFMQGIDFECAATNVLDFRSASGVAVERVVIDDCTARYWYSNSGKAFNFRGVELAIVNNCRAYHGHGDAFSYSVVSVGEPITRAVEINCRGYDLGVPATAGNIINGSTSHEGCVVVRVNGSYGDCYGPVCADVGPGTKNWYVGCSAENSLSGSDDSQDALFQAGNPSGDSVSTWLDGCTPVGGAHFDLYAGAGCQILYRNMDPPASVGGAGVVGTY